jgi:hypothetical protein
VSYQILHRWTGTQLFASETAQTIVEAVAQAIASDANLSGARIAKGTEPPTGWRAVDIGSDYVVTLAKD